MLGVNTERPEYEVDINGTLRSHVVKAREIAADTLTVGGTSVGATRAAAPANACVPFAGVAVALATYPRVWTRIGRIACWSDDAEPRSILLARSWGPGTEPVHVVAVAVWSEGVAGGVVGGDGDGIVSMRTTVLDTVATVQTIVDPAMPFALVSLPRLAREQVYEIEVMARGVGGIRIAGLVHAPRVAPNACVPLAGEMVSIADDAWTLVHEIVEVVGDTPFGTVILACTRAVVVRVLRADTGTVLADTSCEGRCVVALDRTDERTEDVGAPSGSVAASLNPSLRTLEIVARSTLATGSVRPAPSSAGVCVLGAILVVAT
jgi:hypothetical protein